VDRHDRAPHERTEHGLRVTGSDDFRHDTDVVLVVVGVRPDTAHPRR
jgi:hypothetical protein